MTFRTESALLLAACWLHLIPFSLQGQEGARVGLGIQQAVDAVGAEIEEWGMARDPAVIVDAYVYVSKLPKFQELQETLSTDWREALTRLDFYAPTEFSKTIVILALRNLPRDEYLRMLDTALTMTDRSKMSGRLMGWALFPSEGANVALLVNYHRDEEVKTILLKAKNAFRSDEKMLARLNRIISGETKRSRDEFLLKATSKPRAESVEPHRRIATSTPSTLLRAEAKPTVEPVNHENPQEEAQFEPTHDLKWLIIVLAVLASGFIVFAVWRKNE